MRDEAKKVTGGCLCGKVRYEAHVFLKSGYYCHCRMCQKSCGQPADISVPIKAGTLLFTKSKPKYYVSSQYGKRGFCDDCGSRLSWQALDPQNDWMTNVTVGSLDNSEEVEPYRHIFVIRSCSGTTSMNNCRSLKKQRSKPCWMSGSKNGCWTIEIQLLPGHKERAARPAPIVLRTSNAGLDERSQLRFPLALSLVLVGVWVAIKLQNRDSVNGLSLVPI